MKCITLHPQRSYPILKDDIVFVNCTFYVFNFLLRHFYDIHLYNSILIL